MSEAKWVCRGCGSMCGQQTAHGRIADRERRMIRRALAIVVRNCRTLQYPLFADAIDAATRAKKGKRK